MCKMGELIYLDFENNKVLNPALNVLKKDPSILKDLVYKKHFLDEEYFNSGYSIRELYYRDTSKFQFPILLSHNHMVNQDFLNCGGVESIENWSELLTDFYKLYVPTKYFDKSHFNNLNFGSNSVERRKTGESFLRCNVADQLIYSLSDNGINFEGDVIRSINFASNNDYLDSSIANDFLNNLKKGLKHKKNISDLFSGIYSNF